MSSRTPLERLERNRGWVLISAFVVATCAETFVHWHAPPDLLWMLVMALSIYVLFEAGLFCARFFRRK